MREVKNVETIDVEETEVNVEEETRSERFLSKAKAGLKKNGKKVAAIAAVATVVLIGYALGKKKSGNDSDSADTDEICYIEQNSDSASESSEVTED